MPNPVKNLFLIETFPYKNKILRKHPFTPLGQITVLLDVSFTNAGEQGKVWPRLEKFINLAIMYIPEHSFQLLQ